MKKYKKFLSKLLILSFMVSLFITGFDAKAMEPESGQTNETVREDTTVETVEEETDFANGTNDAKNSVMEEQAGKEQKENTPAEAEVTGHGTENMEQVKPRVVVQPISKYNISAIYGIKSLLLTQ